MNNHWSDCATRHARHWRIGGLAAGGCSVSGYEVPVGERCGGSCHAHECWHAALASNDLYVKEPSPKQDEAALKL